MTRNHRAKAVATPLAVMAILGALSGALLAVSPAEAQTVTIESRACADLVRHVAQPGVEYTPGVDVHGKPVVPADLNGAPRIKLPETVHIPVTVDLAARFGIPPTSNLFKPEAYIGTARVRLSDGRAWFNGQPLTSDEAYALARLCQEQGAAPKHR